MALTQNVTEYTNSCILVLTNTNGAVPNGWVGGFNITNNLGVLSPISYTAVGTTPTSTIKAYFIDQINNLTNLSSVVEPVTTIDNEDYLSILSSDDQQFYITVTTPSTVLIESFLPSGFIWANEEADRIAPDVNKMNLGWVIGERPKRQWLNYLLHISANVSTYVKSTLSSITSAVNNTWNRLILAENDIDTLEGEVSDINDRVRFVRTDIASETHLGGTSIIVPTVGSGLPDYITAYYYTGGNLIKFNVLSWQRSSVSPENIIIYFSESITATTINFSFYSIKN